MSTSPSVSGTHGCEHSNSAICCCCCWEVTHMASEYKFLCPLLRVLGRLPGPHSPNCHVTLPLVIFPYEISYILVNKAARTGTTSLGGYAWKSLGARVPQCESDQTGTVSVHKGHEPSFDLLSPCTPSCCLTKVGLTPLQRGKQNCDCFLKIKVLISKMNFLMSTCSGGPLTSYQYCIS